MFYLIIIVVSGILLRVSSDIDRTLPYSTLVLDLLRQDGVAVDIRRQRRLQAAHNRSTNVYPLFQGQGTHYVYLYVGTPPQRVSVIIDTGSHHTAFPCKGCNCGKHMNPSFDPSLSNSSDVLKCSDKKCFFEQSYR